MKERFDSVCGIYCGACSTPGCNGCKIINENHWSPDCEIIKCAHTKEVDACPFCSEHPCDKIMQAEKDEYVHHKTILPNGERIKEIGLDAWLKEQEDRWSCKQCGKRYTWFESNCRSCGSGLTSVDVEFGNRRT